MARPIIFLIVLIGAVLGVGGVASAATLDVPSGAYPTIQSAINAAVDGDTVLVAPGTYGESIDLLDRSITVRSSGGAAVTVLDGTGLGDTIVRCAGGQGTDTVVEGFTLRDGIGTLVEVSPGVFQRHGGAVYLDASDPTIQGCILLDNVADRGGAIYNNDGASPLLIANRFTGNMATLGGAIFNEFSTAVLFNCIFDNNNVGSLGGAMYNTNSSTTITNSTFFANSAFNGGGIYNTLSSSPLITNCILWLNSDSAGTVESSQIFVNGGAPQVDYSIVQGGWSGAGGAGVIDADPDFINAAGGDFDVNDFSPAIDAGSNGALGPALLTDYNGNPRRVDDAGVTDTGAGVPPIVDLGAFEHQVNSELLAVDVPGQFATIQEGIAAAAMGGVVTVGPGVYVETIDLGGKAITLQSADPNDPSQVVIDGNMMDTVISCISGEGPDTIIDGFTVTGGFSLLNGGGMRILTSSPTVRRCRFTMNDAGLGGGISISTLSEPEISDCVFDQNSSSSGGGIYSNLQSSPTILRCTFNGNTGHFGGGVYNAAGSNGTIAECLFSGNTAEGSGFGGAIYCNESDPSILDCTITANNAIDGGGIYISSMSNPRIDRCVISANIAVNRGGGIHNTTQSAPLITSCLLLANQARFGGGIDNNVNGSPVANNCTVVANTAEQQGGGYHNSGGGPSFRNGIVWENTAAAGGDQIYEALDPALNVGFSDVQGGWPGGSNFNVDPMFVAPGGGNYRLMAASPCLNVGLNALVGPGALDLDGNPRIVDVTVDLGAYEFTGAMPVCPADIVGPDGNVDALDFLLLISQWGTPCVVGGCEADITSIFPLVPDGNVDALDYLLLISQWGNPGNCP